MLAEIELPLIGDFADYIELPGTLAAYHLLVGASAALKDYRCVAKFKGSVRDFRFYTMSEEQPFSFIINKSSLLFYFRLPAVKSGRYDIAQLSSTFCDVNENHQGEWTVRVRDVKEAIKLINIAFIDEYCSTNQ